ncbi:MAG: hypothetical protein IKQ30_08410 [Bacteroidales bacterium]|nr:hypothetical protein [Bacteroidales bacterium]
MELKTINIAVIAPTGAGKTALISTVCDYIKRNSNQAKGYTLEIENKAAQELNNFKTELSGKLASKNIEFDAKLIKGTQECTEYKFSINFKAGDEIIKQPFCILDIPGAFINNPYSYENDDEFLRFKTHLDNSRILWIPIDAPVLMETSSSSEKGFSEIQRRTANLDEFVKEWAEYAAENNVVDYCNFVLVKCETYFSQDTNNRHNHCRTRFDESYKPIVDTIRSVNMEDKISCVAVETIGPIAVNGAIWDSKTQNCVVSYMVKDTRRAIAGAECLLSDALQVAKEQAKSVIEQIRVTKFQKAQGLDEERNQLFDKLNAKRSALKKQQDRMNRDLCELQAAESEITNPSAWQKILRTFGFGNIEALRNKIRNLKAHMVSIMNEIEEVNREICNLQESHVYTTADLQKVQAEITGIDALIEHFGKLGNRDGNSPYYRTL